ncbi:hypothetical protein [Nitrosomonas eutropha]|uniref:hypothetical protein n=1 Tax=Nitrosomonas eutropha TaxID=916 RepID=UPI0015A6E8C8|nr:hypothetical protein [Nitrosomonas eutropha]
MLSPILTPHQSQYIAWLLTRRAAGGKHAKLYRELFNQQDEVEAQRNNLINRLEI